MTSNSNWHNEFFAELDKEQEPESEMPEFGGFVYCEECYCVVGESNECLCLVERPEFVQNILERSRKMLNVVNENASSCGSQSCCGGGCG